MLNDFKQQMNVVFHQKIYLKHKFSKIAWDILEQTSKEENKLDSDIQLLGYETYVFNGPAKS